MLSVKIDGKEVTADLSGLRSMGELIELVKATIDPDKIIISLIFNEQPLSDTVWNTPLNSLQGGLLEVQTGEIGEYLKERFTVAEPYLEHIISKFGEAGEHYRKGKFEDANKQLSSSVQDLLAFLNWYMSVLQMKPEKFSTEIGEFNNYVKGLQGVCEGLVQQQMFQAWWALGDTLQSKLTPSLDSLKNFCGKNATTCIGSC